jgi:GT2 family glycosyltransferase
VTPAVSVVVVSWRAREHVLACLASVRDHAGLEHEVIVVDDGSGDGTSEAVAGRFPEARLITKRRNEGLVAGRNTALEHVRGAKVMMLDADTEVLPGALPALAAALDRDPRVALVGPKLVYPDGTLQLSCRRYPPFLIPFLRRGPYPRFVDDDPPSHRWHMMKDFDHARERPVAWVIGAAQMWRSDLPSVIGGYDPRVSSYGGEDKDWCLRVWDADLRVHYVPEAVVMHHEQRYTKRNAYGRKDWRTLRDWYYLQYKHRRLRRDPRLTEANA